MAALGLNLTIAAALHPARLLVMPSAEQQPLSGPKGDAAGGQGAAFAPVQFAGPALAFQS